MLTRTHARDEIPVGPQCPKGQEDGYRLGWHQGQGEMIDTHDGTPCQVIRMQQEIESLRRQIACLVSDDPEGALQVLIDEFNRS